MLRLLARFRVTLGFIVGALCFWLAEPSWRTIVIGGLVAVPGEWGPQYSKYRYVYWNDRVVLVDPSNRHVVHIVE